MKKFEFVVAIFILIVPGIAHAHTPHDEVDVIRLSMSFWFDHSLFAIVRENLYASFDAGKTWLRRFVNLPHSRIRDILVSPNFAQDSCLITVADSGIFYSDNRGESWHPSELESMTLSPVNGSHPGSVRPKLYSAPFFHDTAGAQGALCAWEGRILMSSDFGRHWSDTNIVGGKISCLYADRHHLYLGDESGRIRIFFLNQGVLEQVRALRLETGIIPTVIESCPELGLLVGTRENGILSISQGDVVTQRGLDGKHVTGIFVLPLAGEGSGSVITATEWHDGVYRSRDAGQTWTLASKHLTTDSQADQAQFKTSHFKAITGSRADDGRSVLFVSGFDGLFLSENEGERWTEFHNIVTRDIIVGIDTVMGSTCVASLYGGGIKAVAPQRGAGGDKPVFYGLRTFAIASPPGYLESDSEIWVAVHDGVKVLDSDLRIKREVVLARQSSALSKRAALIRGKLTPLAKKLITYLPHFIRTRLKLSIQQGLSNLNIGMQVPVFGSSFLFTAEFSSSGVAFLRTWEHGLYKTKDWGRTFSYLWSPPDGQWILDADISSNCGSDGGMFLLCQDGLHYSVDEGISWSTLSTLPITGTLVAMAILPTETPGFKMLISASSGMYRLDLNSAYQLENCVQVETCSHGLVFTEISIAPDYLRSGLILANKSGAGLYRSIDGGKRFTPVVSGEALDCATMPGFPDGDTMIAYSRNFDADGKVYAASGCYVYESNNRGLNWCITGSREAKAVTA